MSDADWLTLCRPLTVSFERCVLTAYPDPATGAAPWTIGYGATGAGIAKGVVWTQAQADARLMQDLLARRADVARLVASELSPQQIAAVVDFIFNVGVGNFASSTMRRLLNEGDGSGAAAEFPKWNLAAGVVMPGIVRRRAAEQSLFLTGKWSAS